MDVMIAEDDPTAGLILEKALGRLGHTVIKFTSGEEAWAGFQRSPVRLVITDWMMPGMDGIELVRRIRAHETRLYTYVVFLTALTGKQHLLEGLEAGADDFMTKPVDLDQLAARVRVAERIIRLQEEVKVLQGLLPICSYCKRIREGDENWVAIEQYVAQRSAAAFSHGVCPRCYETILQPQIDSLGA